MASSNYQTASETLALLEERLRRLNYTLHGDSATANNTSDNKPTLSATERFRKLERNLANLSSKSPTASDILNLQSHHPNLFVSTHNDAPSTPPPSSLATLVLAHEPLFRQSSTSLQTLSSQNSIPDPAALAKLIALEPRLERVLQKQDEQAREVAELRARSARVVEKWYQEGVLGMGEKWAGWEETLREGEILVRRSEARERREREGIV